MHIAVLLYIASRPCNCVYVSLCVMIGKKTPTLHDVYKYVVPKCAHKWKFLGVLLHFDQEELDIIFSNFQNDSEECCRSLLSRWLEKNSVASWNQLLSAIDGLPEYPLPKTTSHGMNQKF